MDKAEALKVLLLPPGYTIEELHSAYHKRLFDIHPDTASTPLENVGQLVDKVIKARRLLEECLKKPEPAPAPSAGPGADGYNWYREASSILSQALQDYWQARRRWSQIPEDDPDLANIKERMGQARGLFARVLNDFPGGIWTPDSVEEIARINLWLGGEQRPFTRQGVR